MGDLSRDMLVPRKNADNFIFGFNDIKLSDRVLNIEITSEDTLSTPLMKKQKLTHPVVRNGSDSYVGIDVKSLNVSLSVGSNDSESYVGIEVITLHVNSLILAAKSPFFHKLFTNGMMESQGKDVTLRISSSEKAALMDLLKYIYGSTLSASTSSELLDVLMIANKFEVSCCMKYCVTLLLKITMSLESALSYLELLSTILVGEVIEPLINASKHYLRVHYCHFRVCREAAMELPLFAIEIVLGYEGLRVDSEDDIYDFILEWARAHYPEIEERREVITKRLMQFICFRNMSCSKLIEFRNCPDDFDHEQVTDLVMDALLDKLHVPYGEHIRSSKDLTTNKSGFRGHAYRNRLVKVIYIEYPSPSCVIYFDLKKYECELLIWSKQYASEYFVLGGRWFTLIARYDDLPSTPVPSRHFGLYLRLKEGSETCRYNLEIAVRRKSSEMFESCVKENNCILTDQARCYGYPDLFDIPWNLFISSINDYFIDEVLHLRVDLTIVNSQEA